MHFTNNTEDYVVSRYFTKNKSEGEDSTLFKVVWQENQIIMEGYEGNTFKVEKMFARLVIN